ncbi:MAG: diguanylate cyclase [Ignavibacteriales bacterium]|nr:diguanylate cyclase [Ignavibacteriales bacterium]
MLITFRSWLNSLTLNQKLSVVAGVILFLVGLFSSPWVVKVFSFLLSSASVAYVAVTLRQKARSDREDENGSLTTEEHNPQMKRLVFDDFQDEGGPFRVEFAEKKATAPAHTPERKIPTKNPMDKHFEKPYEFQMSDFFDIDEEVFKRETGPRSEFNFLVKKVLAVVKEVNFAHTVALFWVNNEKKQLVLENFVSDSKLFTTQRRQEIGQDLVSQVAVSGTPKLLTNVNATGQADMLTYYDGPEPVKTFIGVPIFYSRGPSQPRDPVAVLAVDCLSEDAYGTETLNLLGRFTKLISALIRSYTDKYDLVMDSEVLRSISRIREQLKIEFSAYNAVRSLAEETSRLIPWDYISVVLYDETRKAWNIQLVMNRMNDPYVAVANEVDPHESLVGTVLQSSIPKIVDNIQTSGMPRFYRAERCDSRGSLLAMPINSLSRCYGALVVESKDIKTYSDSDVKLMQKVVEPASWGLEILSLNEVTNNFVMLDETTGVATQRYFLGRVQEEVQRANDFSAEISIVMISIDNVNEYISRYGKEGFEFVLQNVSRMIKSSIRTYDLVGRFDHNRFAVMLVNTTPNEASLWSEKLRRNVASNVINIEQQSFSVTISVGVSGATGETNDLELLENADRVLRKAIEAGGNIVRVF